MGEHVTSIRRHHPKESAVGWFDQHTTWEHINARDKNTDGGERKPPHPNRTTHENCELTIGNCNLRDFSDLILTEMPEQFLDLKALDWRCIHIFIIFGLAIQLKTILYKQKPFHESKCWFSRRHSQSFWHQQNYQFMGSKSVPRKHLIWTWFQKTCLLQKYICEHIYTGW